ETGIAPRPILPAIIRDSDDAAAPQSPARRPQSAVAIDDEIVDDVSREGHTVACIRPTLRAISGQIDLTAARTEIEEIRIRGIGDERTNISTEESASSPLRRSRKGQEKHDKKNEGFTHRRPD